MTSAGPEREIDRVAEVVDDIKIGAQIAKALQAIEASTQVEADRCWLELRLLRVLLGQVTPRLIENARVTRDTDSRRRRYVFAHDSLAPLVRSAPTCGHCPPPCGREVAALCAEWVPVLEGLRLAAGAADA